MRNGWRKSDPHMTRLAPRCMSLIGPSMEIPSRINAAVQRVHDYLPLVEKSVKQIRSPSSSKAQQAHKKFKSALRNYTEGAKQGARLFKDWAGGPGQRAANETGFARRAAVTRLTFSDSILRSFAQSGSEDLQVVSRFLAESTGEPSAEASDSSLPGTQFLETELNRAYDGLATEPIWDGFRASLIGGRWAALSLLQHESKLGSLWGDGDSLKASKLIEVWASTVALGLYQNEPDQDAVCESVGRGLAALLGSDEETGYRELKAYKDQQATSPKVRAQGGIPTYHLLLLYLRSRRALGTGSNLAAIPIPIPSISELLDTGLIEPDDNPLPDAILLLAELEARGTAVANEAFNSLREQGSN